MSLSTPHSIWMSANSPFEVCKAVISARMLSDRYRTDKLMSKWSTDNPSGVCRLPGCEVRVGDLQHILLECPALSVARKKAIDHWSAFLVSRPWLLPIVAHHTLGAPEAPVIESNKVNSNIVPNCFYLARTWNFGIHLTRDKICKLWNLKNQYKIM